MLKQLDLADNDNGGEYRRNRKMLMKLLVYGPASTDDEHFHEPPSRSVTRSSPCTEQVSQANPVVENLSQHPKSNREIIRAMALLRRQNNTRLGVEASYGDH